MVPAIMTGGNGTRRKLFYVTALLLTLMSLYLVHHQMSLFNLAVDPSASDSVWMRRSGAIDHRDQLFYSKFNALTSSYRDCLLENLKNSTWTKLHVAVPTCMGGALEKLLDIRSLLNYDDEKLVILPPTIDSKSGKDNRMDFDCVEVTLGVGDDIESEKQLRELVPWCRFFGADPILASGLVFEELGPYFEIAVGPESGVLPATVLEDGMYRRKEVSTITLLDFLKHYAKVDHVDYLFLDNEGPEYGLFQQFQPGGILDGFTICQISVEMHGPMPRYITDERLDELITETINNTAYLPFWSAAPVNHLRSYYVNVKDKYCVDTYFRNR